MKTPNLLTSLVLAGCSLGMLAAAPTLAQAATTACPIEANTTVGDLVACQTKVNKDAKLPRKAVAAALDAKAQSAVTNATTAATAPDAFAGRVHASYQDFFRLFNFGINKVEESTNGQALTIRFNPLRSGSTLIGTSLTLAKPAPSDDLLKGIPEASRSQAKDKLQQKLADTDDRTWALSYSFQSGPCSAQKLSVSACWGRSDEIYSDALATLLESSEDVAQMASSAVRAEKEGLSAQLAELLASEALAGDGSVFQLKFQSLPEAKKADVLALVERFGRLDAEQIVSSKKFYTDAGFGNLFTLIDNQPQLAITASYRQLGDLLGPDETAASVEYQVGRKNLNRLFSAGHGDPAEVLKILKSMGDTMPSDKFVFSATYKKRNAFSVTSLAGLGLGDLANGFTPVDLKSTTEYKVRLQWGCQFGANLDPTHRNTDPQTPGPQKARWDFTLEGDHNEKGGTVTKDRWVAAYTLTLPIRDQMNFPLTISYANKPEFLDQQSRQISAHFGISYRIPWGNP